MYRDVVTERLKSLNGAELKAECGMKAMYFTVQIMVIKSNIMESVLIMLAKRRFGLWLVRMLAAANSNNV